MRKLHNILITGGAGFIGSNFVHYLFGLSSAEGNLFNDAEFSGTVVNVIVLLMLEILNRWQMLMQNMEAVLQKAVRDTFLKKLISVTVTI